MNTSMDTRVSVTLPPWTYPLMLFSLRRYHTSKKILQRLPREDLLTVWFLGLYQEVHRCSGSFRGKINKGKQTNQK